MTFERPVRLMDSMPKPAETLRMDDTELVALAKQGCSQAFTELVRKYHLGLRAYLVRRIGNLSVADDVAQEVFLAAVHQLSSFDENRSFRAWLFTVARNKAVDYLRTVSRERTNESEIENLLAQENVSRSQTCDSTSSEMLIETLAQCLEKLKPKSRSLVESIYFQNITAEEIARSSNQKGSSIRMSLLRIRKALAKCIRRQLGSEIEL